MSGYCEKCSANVPPGSEANIDLPPARARSGAVRLSPSLSAALAMTLTLSGCAHIDQQTCPDSPAELAKIDGTVRSFFHGLRKEDADAFKRLTTSSFYSFDVGKRFVGTELMGVVRDAHARGVQLNWKVGQIDTHLSCNMAWAAWENVGSAGVPPRVEPVRWLESAVLVRQDGEWKIDFFHSTRAPAVR